MYKRKISVLVLFAFLFTMAFPLAALANSNSKVLFMDNWKIQQEKQMQNDYSRPVSGEIKIEAEFAGSLFRDILGINVMDADIKYDMDVQKEVALINLSANVEGNEEQEIAMEIYLDGSTLIIPVDYLGAMDLLSDEMELPAENIEYVYTEMDGFSFAELQSVLDQSSQQEAAMDLVEIFFEAVPEQSFSSKGRSAFLNLDKDSLSGIVESFQNEDYIARLADKIAALDPTTDREEIITGLTLPGDVSVVDLFKNLKINKCQTEISPDKSLSDWDFVYSTEEFVMDCQIKSNGTMTDDKIESTMSANANLKSSADDNSTLISFNSDLIGDKDKYAMTGVFSICGLQFEEEYQINMNFSIDQSYQDMLDLLMPVLTEENSINSIELEPELVEYDDDYALITMNLNDEDYIWFDNLPFIENDRVLVPVAELGQYLDYQVTWEPPSTVCINASNKAMSIKAGSKQYAVNGEVKEMDTAPVIKDGVSYAPISFIASELGYEVSYDQELEELYLTPLLSK